MLGPLILYLKGMRRMMFQLSGFYYRLAGKPVVLHPQEPKIPVPERLNSKVLSSNSR